MLDLKVLCLRWMAAVLWSALPRPALRWFALLWFWVVPFASARVITAEEPIRLLDVTAASGMNFEHDDGTGEGYLYELMAAGLATFDYDNDGRSDVYLLNGGRLPAMLWKESQGEQETTVNPSPPATNSLFRGIPAVDAAAAIQFEDVSKRAALADTGFGLGVASADYDNDGFADLYITNYGANRLFRNNGDGTFSDVTGAAGVGDGVKFGAGAVFLDIDADGDLDLFSGNYVDFSFERHSELAPVAYPFPPGPKDFPPQPDSLFRNDGDGTFANISRSSGIADVAGPSMGAIASDFDLDGDQDLFVCCDGVPDHLFVGDGRGRFLEESILAGVAYDARGNANGSMGADAADLNGDQIEDLFVTDYADQLPMLFISQAPGFFLDETRRRNAGRGLLPHVNWGTGLVDFDNDGDRDIFVANGHFLKDTRRTAPQTEFAVPNVVLHNMGTAEFEEQPMDWSSHVASSRGVAFEDLDQDGDLDVVLLNCADRAQVLENRSPADNSWLQIQLVGRTINRSAVGARVLLSGSGYTAVAQVHSGRGYQSDFGKVLHFGLGKMSVVDSATILWPDGSTQRLSQIPANQRMTIVQTSEPR